MKSSSIFYTITIIFITATISIFLAFWWLMDFDQQNYTRELNTKYSAVSRSTLLYLGNFIDKSEYDEQMKSMKMPEIKDETQKNKILENAEVLQEINADIGTSAILKYNKAHYLKLTHNDIVVLLKDSDYQQYRYVIIKLFFAIITLIVLVLYIFVILKIKPLRKLKRQIDKFALGDLDIKNVSTGKDEISEVANAFYNAVMQIKALNHSRQLFLRNIMHELKTPITKGRITSEMIEKGKYKERLISVFERLENLINEFAAVERATSGFVSENLQQCNIINIIDEAIDIAMIEKEHVRVELIDDITIQADFKLISIAVKNMIDNAMKYSPDKHITIVVCNEDIKFITKGQKLQNALEYYTQPFTQGSNAQKSFGLGLYIVDNILKSHKFYLDYEYSDGFNVFKFKLSKSNKKQ